jgi:type VI protein secretion system component VasF
VVLDMPRVFDVINEKIDLIERLLNLSERVGSQEERENLKQLRKVELEVIKDIILNSDQKG